MNRIKQITAAALLTALLPLSLASGQEKKSEQKIKVIIADDDGTEIILDTLITGKEVTDSIVLKDGRTIHLLTKDAGSTTDLPVRKQYLITSTITDGTDNQKDTRKEITIITSDREDDMDTGKDGGQNSVSVSSGSQNEYVYTIDMDRKDGDEEKTKYVINRDGIVITVEGSNYNKVRQIIKDIEKTLDSNMEGK